MYRLVIGVGYSVFSEINKPFLSDFQGLFEKIKQHTIILSNSIVDYYLNNFPDSQKEDFKNFLASIMYNEEESLWLDDYLELDAKQNLFRFVADDSTRILISKEAEFHGFDLSQVNIITLTKIKKNDFNDFYRYTFPIDNHYAIKGESCEVYSKWFGHLFENETRIKIIDRYFFMNNGLGSFEKYYLPKISKDTVIEIYCSSVNSERDFTEEEILRLIRNKYSDWKIIVHLCNPYHERYILLSSIQISIGTGLCFLDPCGFIKFDSTTLTFSVDKKPPLPKTVKILCQ